MDDLHEILLVGLFSYLLEYMQIQFKLSILNVFLFVNIIGLYYIIKKIKIDIKIEYNSAN
jgi:hypothetical protein